MADGATCMKFFGRDYTCESMVVFSPAVSTPPPTVAVAQVAAEKESKESCRYVRSGSDYYEVCTPRSQDPAAAPATKSIWSAIGDAVMFILETNAKYAPKAGPRR